MINIEKSEKKHTHLSSHTVYIKTSRKKRVLLKEKELRFFEDGDIGDVIKALKL